MTDGKILIDDFIKLDLRVGRVLDAKEVENSRKMLELTIDIGIEQRKIFAGIKKTYSPSDIIGKNVVVIANLLPREMKFGTSDGMVLATSYNEEVIIINPEKDVSPGAKVS